MSELVLALRRDIEAFVEQREAVALVFLTKQPSDALQPFMMIDAIGDASQRDYFVLFSEDCHDVDAYWDAFFETCAAQIEQGNELIREGAHKEGAEEWLPLTAECFDRALSARRRLRALIEHIRVHVPDPSQRIVLGFLPLQKRTRAAYNQLVAQLALEQAYEPWMAGLRLVLVAQEGEADFLLPWVESNASFALVRPVDFSSQSVADDIARTAANPEAPMELRMEAFVQMAAFDFSFRRYEESISKYRSAYAYYRSQREDAMASLCLLQWAAAEEQLGQIDDARERYRQAIDLAAPSDVKPVMLNAFLALASSHQAQGDWQGAHDYWMSAVLTARELSNAVALADATERLGICKVALGDNREALEVWEVARTTAEDCNYFVRALSVLEHMVLIAQREGLDDAAADYSRQCDRIRSLPQIRAEGPSQ